MSEINGPVNWGNILESCPHRGLSLFTILPLTGRKITHSWERKSHLCMSWSHLIPFSLLQIILPFQSICKCKREELEREDLDRELFAASGLGHWRWGLTHPSFPSCAIHWSMEWASHFTWRVLKNKHAFPKKSKLHTPWVGHIHQSTCHHSISSFVYWLPWSAIPCSFIEWETEWSRCFLCEHNENVASGSFPHACYLEAFPSI